MKNQKSGKGQLSKAEYKYRMKFIQECHYNKSEQRIFDEAVTSMDDTYKMLYKSMRSGNTYMFMATIAAKRMAKSMSNVCVSVMQATKIFSAIGKALKESEAKNATRKKTNSKTKETH